MFQDEIFEPDFFYLDQKNQLAEWFYSHYHSYTPDDIYGWLWAGEFGYPPNQYPGPSLQTLLNDIRMSRHHPCSLSTIWEPLGLELALIKINIKVYADTGCPIPILIEMSERIREEINPNAMRFKSNWNLMKAQIFDTAAISLADVHSFEDRIPFNMTPYLPFSENYQIQFGRYYRIVPANFFFERFPEFETIYDKHDMGASRRWTHIITE